MEKKYICNNDYSISPTNTIALPVTQTNLPATVVVNGNELSLKDSFHVSLVCINEIIRKHNVTIPDFKDKVVEDFCKFTANNPMNLIGYTNEFRYCEQDDLTSVVVMCDISNFDKFFKELNSKYNLNIETPPSHVTLYVKTLGIFLTDQKDLDDFTKVIENPVGRQL